MNHLWNEETGMRMDGRMDEPGRAMIQPHERTELDRQPAGPNGTGGGNHRVRARRVLGWALAILMGSGSVLGAYTVYHRMDGQLKRQAVQLAELTDKLAVQADMLSQTNNSLGETRSTLEETLDVAELAMKAEALSRTGSSASTGNLPGANASAAQTALVKGSTVTDIAESVGPSVVGIRMTITTSTRFYQANQRSSEGSGVIISSDGYLVTNYHVVSYADPANAYSKSTTLEVFLPDGRSAKATYVGGDSENDLAVLKINLTGLKAAELGSSAGLKVGELAVAIGNPLGMEFAGSVTVGVVSALNRKLDGEETSINLIQTDAAINPGNSGGALVNSQGQIVGINTAKIAQTGVEGIGFAIAIDDAKPIISSLIAYGYVRNRPNLGIAGQDITAVMASMYNVPVGVYVTKVDADGGAAKAGVQTGDIITGLAGKEVATLAELNSIKKAHKAGETVSLQVVRGTRKLSLQVTFTEAR
jgi:serine protease Do